jgi:hypothetical protein
MSNELQDKTNKTAATIGTQSLHYKSFLVRLWCENEAAPWRASVTHISTDETQFFSNVEALLIFLHEQATTRTINDESHFACSAKPIQTERLPNNQGEQKS